MTEQYIKSIGLKRESIADFEKYPFSLPAVRSRQMSLVARMHDLINLESQFIIATHSPIIMAYPDSFIYEIGDGIRKVIYEETEHFQIMKAFINNKEKMLQELMLSEQ